MNAIIIDWLMKAGYHCTHPQKNKKWNDPNLFL